MAAMKSKKRRPRVAAAEQAQTSPTETFGQRLVRLRKAHGFTQTELGSRVGTTQRMVAYYERENARRPPMHLLPGLAAALKVTVDELVGYEQLKDEPPPRNARLWRKLRAVEKLSEPDRKAVLRFVDALLVKQRFEQRG
jgi:transcriptional regulator with XRE-family HTH domain